VAAGVGALVPYSTNPSVKLARPAIAPSEGYLGADGCRPCHESAYRSWHASFHRTMTARPSAEALLPWRDVANGRGMLHLDDGARPSASTSNFAGSGDAGDGGPTSTGASLAFDGTVLRAREKGGREELVPFVTGKHRYQVYWLPVRDGQGRSTGQFTPFSWVFLAEERRFIPRTSAFVSDPALPETHVYWSSNCIQCHTTDFAPKEAEGRFDPEVADLGIACESCHGPSAGHAARYRSPVARFASSRFFGAKRKPADEIPLHPTHIAPAKSAQICGRCHALTLPRDENTWFSEGYRGREVASDPLDRARLLLGPSTTEAHANVGTENFFDGAGRLRVTGREYQALAASPCFSPRGDGADHRRGITCTDCHSMHDPVSTDQQLKPHKDGDAACTQCHANDAKSAPHRLHETANSTISCVDCHMPKRVYGLLGVRRSHQIEAHPDQSLGGTPSACQLCHLTGGPVPARARTLAEGDAADRVLLAGLLGTDTVVGANRNQRELQKDLLQGLANDPYPAVRLVTARALARRPDLGLPFFDPLAAPPHDDRRRNPAPVTLSE
jgi:hypothetical protein